MTVVMKMKSGQSKMSKNKKFIKIKKPRYYPANWIITGLFYVTAFKKTAF